MVVCVVVLCYGSLGGCVVFWLLGWLCCVVLLLLGGCVVLWLFGWLFCVIVACVVVLC